ncbi:hypothetical protein CEY16_14150 [Halalkalibacillus sediminis]|uniref:Pilus assembly protein PilM n=1 Tax=Halalkalibacillus sediminis TaxID=2018042 RepID=A0A2I0QRI2_9BACI|nr:pilus assembly protein PilM [Halalkalibacillus sediminis]PKR76944.1 hypothetical protein CEY16_14150 [Halalkalibacillus sediminis]
MKKNSVVNLEIRDYVIRFSEIKKNNPKKVERLGEHFLPAGIVVSGLIEKRDEFQKILRACVKKWRLKRKKVQLTMPDSLVIVRKQKIPAEVPTNEIQQYIKFSLGESIHLPFDQPIVETILLKDDDEGKEISLISTDKEVVFDYESILAEEKLKLVAVDISSLNYYRVINDLNLVSEEDHVFMIQYNVNNVIFSAFEKHEPLFLQEFPLEGSDESISYGPSLTKDDLSRSLVFEELDEIRTEIERVERFYQYSMNEGKQKFTKIVVVGDHPYLDEIIEKLREDYETTLIDFEDKHVQGPKGMQVEEKYFNVLGLAMREGY